MQVNPNIGDTIIFFWFGLAVFMEVVSSIVFLLWLRRHGVKLVFGLTGIPGYMERAYLEWCNAQGRSGISVIVLRALLLINAIGAGIIFIKLMISK